jgi:CRISPR-associated protein Csb2
VHQSLVKLVGEGAPPVLTGAYLPDAGRPANRVAIQFLSVAAARAVGLADDAPWLAVLLPADAAAAELAEVTAALGRLREVRRAGVRLRIGTTVAPRSARTFWPAPSPGVHRQWRTEPAVVPDTRPLRGGPWSLADTATLSVGLVLRDRLAAPGRGTEWYRQLAAAAARAGVRVSAARRMMDGDLTRYVHKVPPGVVVQPYRAVLDLGAALGSRPLVAIGQSRHLGGGLLVPLDLAGSEAA